MGKIFYSPTKGIIKEGGLINEITNYLNYEPQKNYKIIIGTDSHAANQQKKVDFITAIVLHRVGSGGRYFWQKNQREKIVSLRQRMYEEVNLSLVTAQNLIDKLKNYINPENLLSQGLEIHVDVGENGPTKEMIKEVVGIVKGNGFNVKTKPEAYGASHVADKHAK